MHHEPRQATDDLFTPSARARRQLLAVGGLAAAVSACTSLPTAQGPGSAGLMLTLPLLRGWFEGVEVLYITTDVSHADVAQAKDATFAPRLATALPSAVPQTAGGPPARSASVDKVYAVTNFEQGSIFASAPSPVGPASRDTAYTPLWQMVKLTWRAGHTARLLKSQEEVLAAAEAGQLEQEPTPVVLNCPIVQRGGTGGLPGMQVGTVWR